MFFKKMLVGAAALAMSFSSFVALGGTTYLTLQTPSGNINNPQKQYQTNIYGLGDSTFNEIKELKTSLASEISQAIQATSGFKSLNYVNVNFAPLKAKLTGSSNRVALTVSGIDVDASARFKGIAILCPTVTGRISFDNLRVNGTYNYSTGGLTSLQARYDGVDVNLRCSGVVGGIISSLLSSFANNYIEDKIGEAARQKLNLDNYQDMFSIQPLLARYSDQASNILGIDLEGFTGNIISGVNLEVSAYPDRYGTNSHQLTIDVFQTAPSISDAYYLIDSRRTTATIGSPGATFYEAYTQSDSIFWRSSRGRVSYYGRLSSIGAIAHGQYGLFSYPSYKNVREVGNLP